MAVAGASAGHVEPVVEAVGLQDELVEEAVVPDVLGIEPAGGLVAQVDVGGFTSLVLAVGDASYQGVELWAAVA